MLLIPKILFSLQNRQAARYFILKKSALNYQRAPHPIISLQVILPENSRYFSQKISELIFIIFWERMHSNQNLGFNKLFLFFIIFHMHRKKYPKALNHITYSIHNHETVYCQCFGNKHSNSFSYDVDSSLDRSQHQKQQSEVRSSYRHANKSIHSSFSNKSQYIKQKIPLSSKMPIRKTLQNKLEQFFDKTASQMSKQRKTDNLHSYQHQPCRNSVYVFKQNNGFTKDKGNNQNRNKMISILQKDQRLSKLIKNQSSKKLIPLKCSENANEEGDDFEGLGLSSPSPRKTKEKFLNDLNVIDFQSTEIQRYRKLEHKIAEPNTPIIKRKNTTDKGFKKDQTNKMHRQTHTEDLTLLKYQKTPEKLDDMVKKKHLSYRTSDFSLDDGSQVTRIALPIARNFKLITEQYDDYN